MKFSTARRLVFLQWFNSDETVRLLRTATRVCVSGNTKRFGFADGSVLESVNGNWRVVEVKKLKEAQKRYGVKNDEKPGITVLQNPRIPTVERLQREVEALQALCDEKDTLIDNLQKPTKWWFAGLLVVTIFALHAFGVI
jgi:hypothetical protein